MLNIYDIGHLKNRLVAFSDTNQISFLLRRNMHYASNEQNSFLLMVNYNLKASIMVRYQNGVK